MRVEPAVLVVSIAITGAAIGCSSQAAQGADAIADGGFLGQCIPGQTNLVGGLDGQPVHIQGNFGMSSQQGTLPYMLDIPSPSAPAGVLQVHLQWSTPVPTGQKTMVTGTLVMPTGSPHGGETLCVGAGSMEYASFPDAGLLTDEKFVLEMLSVGPSCPGAALPGRIDGCLAPFR